MHLHRDFSQAVTSLTFTLPCSNKFWRMTLRILFKSFVELFVIASFVKIEIILVQWSVVFIMVMTLSNEQVMLIPSSFISFIKVDITGSIRHVSLYRHNVEIMSTKINSGSDTIKFMWNYCVATSLGICQRHHRNNK